MNLVDKMRCAIDAYIALLPETGHGNIDDSRLMEIAYVANKVLDNIIKQQSEVNEPNQKVSNSSTWHKK